MLIRVGASVDIVAGRFREAPRWMTRVGLEWLFRLAQEPRRLARRYLVDDPWILLWALRTRLSGQGVSFRPALGGQYWAVADTASAAAASGIVLDAWLKAPGPGPKRMNVAPIRAISAICQVLLF